MKSFSEYYWRHKRFPNGTMLLTGGSDDDLLSAAVFLAGAVWSGDARLLSLGFVVPLVRGSSSVFAMKPDMQSLFSGSRRHEENFGSKLVEHKVPSQALWIDDDFSLDCEKIGDEARQYIREYGAGALFVFSPETITTRNVFNNQSWYISTAKELSCAIPVVFVANDKNPVFPMLKHLSSNALHLEKGDDGMFLQHYAKQDSGFATDDWRVGMKKGGRLRVGEAITRKPYSNCTLTIGNATYSVGSWNIGVSNGNTNGQ